MLAKPTLKSEPISGMTISIPRHVLPVSKHSVFVYSSILPAYLECLQDLNYSKSCDLVAKTTDQKVLDMMSV